LYVAGQLDPDDTKALRAHLASGCVGCAGTLAEAETTFHAIPFSLDPLAPPVEARDRLMQRISGSDAERTARGDAPGAYKIFPTLPVTRRSRWVWPVVGALAASLLVSVVLLRNERVASDRRLAVARADAEQAQAQVRAAELLVARARDGESAGQARASAAEQRLREVDEKLQLVSRGAAELKSMLEAQNLTLVSLPGERPGMANGRVLYDVSNRRWHVRVFDMQPLPPGKTYELWFITPDQQKLPAGTFDVDAKGNGSIMVSVPAGVKVALAAVTDEPAGGVQIPTGSVHLAGKVQVQ